MALYSDAFELCSFVLGIITDTLKSIVWCQFEWPWPSFKVTRLLEMWNICSHVCCELAWSGQNVCNGWLCKGGDCEGMHFFSICYSSWLDYYSRETAGIVTIWVLEDNNNSSKHFQQQQQQQTLSKATTATNTFMSVLVWSFFSRVSELVWRKPQLNSAIL